MSTCMKKKTLNVQHARLVNECQKRSRSLTLVGLVGVEDTSEKPDTASTVTSRVAQTARARRSKQPQHARVPGELQPNKPCSAFVMPN